MNIYIYEAIMQKNVLEIIFKTLNKSIEIVHHGPEWVESCL